MLSFNTIDDLRADGIEVSRERQQGHPELLVARAGIGRLSRKQRKHLAALGFRYSPRRRGWIC